MYGSSPLLPLGFACCGLIFSFWPLILLATWIKNPGRRMHAALIVWVLGALIRFLLLFDPEPALSLLIPEPANTGLFLAVGVGLFGLAYGIEWSKTSHLFNRPGRIDSVAALQAVSPAEFEELVVTIFRAMGHTAQRTGTVGDHGVDVIIQTKTGEKCIVQCKRWQGYVGEPIIRDFYGVMQHEKADKGIIITAGKFSRAALEWAQGKPIILYDGEQFLQLWKRARARRPQTPLT